MDTGFGKITEQQLIDVTREYRTPIYIYSESALEQAAQEALAFPSEYGLTVRYAMKALPTRRILQLFDGLGLHLDASSFYEVQRAQAARIDAAKIQLTAQQLHSKYWELKKFMQEGGKVTACSLHQLETLATVLGRDSYEIGIRINPGLGSGHSHKTNVGGSLSSFGIWHEQIDQAREIIERKGLQVTTLHTHIGSGSNPADWEKVAQMSLTLVECFPDVKTLDLGGGFKVARMPDEIPTNLQECGSKVKQKFVEFYQRTGRKLHLEIEPGTYMTANAGIIVAEVIDVKSTDKYHFMVVDSGMTENARPALYGAQHHITLIPFGNEPRAKSMYVVAGHCCESGDIWTPDKSDPGLLLPRELPAPEIGDLLILGGAGAYCSGMSMSGYNSFPAAPEVLVRKDGILELIRARQTLEQLMENEDKK